MYTTLLLTACDYGRAQSGSDASPNSLSVSDQIAFLYKAKGIRRGDGIEEWEGGRGQREETTSLWNEL